MKKVLPEPVMPKVIPNWPTTVKRVPTRIWIGSGDSGLVSECMDVPPKMQQTS